MAFLRRHGARGLFIAEAFAGCSSELARTAALAVGEICFTPVRGDGSVADKALIAVPRASPPPTPSTDLFRPVSPRTMT